MQNTNTIETGYQSTFTGQPFSSTQIPVSLWFLAKNKAAEAKRGFRDPRKQTLFIDARCRARVDHKPAV